MNIVSKTEITWYEEFSDDINAMIPVAMDEVLADCVLQAQLPESSGGAPRDTSAMANNIRFEAATKTGDRWSGWFGNTAQDYTLVQERKHGFLARAADKHFPTFEERLHELTPDPI